MKRRFRKLKRRKNFLEGRFIFLQRRFIFPEGWLGRKGRWLDCLFVLLKGANVLCFSW